MIQLFPDYCVSVHVLLCHSIYATGLPFSLPILRVARISLILRCPLHSFHIPSVLLPLHVHLMPSILTDDP
jgi:hypothetical protein